MNGFKHEYLMLMREMNLIAVMKILLQTEKSKNPDDDR
jgi:hypothetical protein